MDTCDEDWLKKYINSAIKSGINLGVLNGCNLGTLKKVNLCDLEIRIPNEYTCDVILTISLIENLDSIDISRLKAYYDNDLQMTVFDFSAWASNIRIHIELELAQDSTCQNKGWIGSIGNFVGGNNLLPCSQTIITIGQYPDQMLLRGKFAVDLFFQHKEPKIMDFEIDFGNISIGCIAKLSSFFSNKKKSVEEELNNIVTKTGKDQLETMLKDKFWINKSVM